jgi:hypothetical protein
MGHTDWLNRPIELARSAGGVYAFRSPWDGLVKGDVAPWPPPELVQKLYQSRQSRAYRDADLATATAAHGFYADLQSVHSEDAVTWSLFGPLAYAPASVRSSYAAQLLALIAGGDIDPSPAHIWLWRRLPHPDTLVPGGPEIDFGVQTHRVLLLGEAKWRSSVGAAQGVDGSKDQVQLRVEFCEKYGDKLYPGVERFVVLLVSQRAGALTDAHRALGTERVQVFGTTWEQIGGLAANPWREEFVAQLRWRQTHSQAS